MTHDGSPLVTKLVVSSVTSESNEKVHAMNDVTRDVFLHPQPPSSTVTTTINTSKMNRHKQVATPCYSRITISLLLLGLLSYSDAFTGDVRHHVAIPHAVGSSRRATSAASFPRSYLMSPMDSTSSSSSSALSLWSSSKGGDEFSRINGRKRRKSNRRPALEALRSRLRSCRFAALEWMNRTKRVKGANSRVRSLAAAIAVALSTVMMSTSNTQSTPLSSGREHQSVPHHSAAAAARVASTSRSTGSLYDKYLAKAGAGDVGISSSSSVMRAAAQNQNLDLRGGGTKKIAENPIQTASEKTSRTLKEAVQDLQKYMQGPKSDTLLLLLATALITPLCKSIGTSPILGFLAAGMLLGPNGFGLISGIHTTETLAELGIVFFLFEMGIELSFDRLISMKKDVFGLGLSQFITTAIAVGGVGKFCGLPGNACVVLGGGLALSSSAFVLQLLKDKDQLATRFGKASFGVLLFQDLAVVPLLVVTPILAGGGKGLASAVGSAVVKAAMALGSIAFAGRVVLNPLFKTVAGAKSQEAFLGVILLTVLSMSFMTEGLGLSNTLGAFLAGVLLSETKYRYQIEADIAPFRGILLGLFFVTVGFEIDLGLIASNIPLVGAIVSGIVIIKAVIAASLGRMFGLSLSTAQQTGLILSQGGEFAFVAFGLARNLGIFDPQTTKLLLTCVSLTMALTPFLADAGQKIATKLEEKSDFTHYLGQDQDAVDIKDSEDFAVVIGYGAVGKVICDLLDRKFIKYVGLEVDPNKAIQARNKGLPVFYGDVARSEVAEAFNVGKAKAVICTISDKAEANRAVIALRRLYPDVKIFARAKDADHAERLQRTLDVAAMVPILPEDNALMTLPFGGAVLRSLGAPAEEVNAILEQKRKDVLSGRGLAESEQETVLLQLGIVEEKKRVEPPKVIEVKAQEDNNEGAKDEQVEEAAATAIKDSELAAAAAARAEESKQKAPMVAKVIEDCIVTPPSAKSEEAVEEGEAEEKVIL